MAKSYKKKGFQKKFKPRQIFEKCQFCEQKKLPDYKMVDEIKKYIRETGKITSRKINSNCAKHQRKVAKAIKRARHLALLPFTQKVK